MPLVIYYKMDKKEKQAIGRASRKAGKLFESRVRKDLEENGWIVDRWSNDIDFENDKLKPSKPKYFFNPKTKDMKMMGLCDGFPDFLAYKFHKGYNGVRTYEMIGVESKLNGKLDKEEKRKVKWLLENHIFGKIFVSSKHKEGRRVVVEQEEVFG